MPNVPFMIAHGCYYAALGLWIGMMAMLAAGTRTAFDILPEKAMAGNLAGAWLSKYYRMGVVCAAVAAIGATLRSVMAEQGLWQGPPSPQQRIAAMRYGLISLMILNHLYAGWVLDPEVKRLKSIPEAREAFQSLHRREVLLLALNLLCGLAVIFLS